ncbi:transporter substrate-binding domain-containing protein [Herbaspirillum sp. C9C3]|uniref:substrate-binding periplasmic protein n=1 Tax=Herbaspirillum sp. C9C3 TaxID=2735271 RepID=UPI001585AB56|nr:transporter substrate-binding domain-containing protein [Herbaspirillum sp. C9C3]NUT61239.1 transporter substrate-binding domain-containing protein [Herbaspirillum sp. C9C3]
MGASIFSRFFRNRAVRACANAATLFAALLAASPSHAADVAGSSTAAGPDCSRAYTLALHDHGLLYSAATDTGIDKDFADELIRRSGCKVNVSLMSRARIWQLIESGALDFSLSGITNAERDRFASFAWYFSNKYYLLVRKDAGITQLADIARSERFQLGVIRGFRYSSNANRVVDELAAANRVTLAGGLEPLYEALLQNRIQGMIMEPFDYPVVGEKRIREATTIISFEDPSVLHGLIMSRQALPPAEQEKWRALVNGMLADGTVLRIFRKYFNAELAAAMVQFQSKP